MKITIYGLDLAKRVMQLHWVDWDTGEIHRKQVKRGKLLEFFVNRDPGIIAMEACGSAHYWARELGKLGHEARLIAAQFVRPFVKTNKNDAADAAAIWEAAVLYTGQRWPITGMYRALRNPCMDALMRHCRERSGARQLNKM